MPHDKRDKWNARNLMPTDLSSGASSPQLSSQRQSSNIPMKQAETLPHHQQASQNVWVYPSEQMFFNAMKRKASREPLPSL